MRIISSKGWQICRRQTQRFVKNLMYLLISCKTSSVESLEKGDYFFDVLRKTISFAVTISLWRDLTSLVNVSR